MNGNRGSRTLADFVAGVLVHEGAWVIEPTLARDNSFIARFLDHLRFIPVRISSPVNTNRYAFAERGAEGKWFFVWVPSSRERV